MRDKDLSDESSLKIGSASDLHPISPFNHFFKYTDDTYLLVPATNSLSIPSEIQHILDWATANNLKLNNSKSREMIVHLPRRRKFFPNPIAIPGIERVDRMNILGVTVSHTLTFHHHISALVAKCSRSFFALKTIRAHGLNGNALWDINSCNRGVTTPVCQSCLVGIS